MIFHNKGLEQVAAVKPRTIGDLLAIDGIGPAKVEKYGQELIELVGQSTEKGVFGN